MTAKEIYESIDLSQLPKESADKLRKVEKATEGFTIESDKVNNFMTSVYNKIKQSKPTALKNLKVEEKVTKTEVKKGNTTQVVEDLEYKVKGKKKVTKKTPTPSEPKKSTFLGEVKKRKKKGEAWEDAKARVKKELDEERAKAKADAEKVVSKTSQALKNLEKMLRDDPKLAGYPRTYGKQSKKIDAAKDAKIKARPAGKRVSKKGHKNQYGESKGGRVYWENRDNRSDRYAPDFPNKVFLEVGGELDDLGFPMGHTFLVVEVSPSGDKKLIKKTTDYITALTSSAVARGMKSSKDARVVIVDMEEKKVIHEAFEAGGEITITPTQLINNPDALVGTTSMTELFECGGVTAYQEGGEVFVTPYPLTNAGSGDYVAGSNTMSNMFEDGGQVSLGMKKDLEFFEDIRVKTLISEFKHGILLKYGFVVPEDAKKYEKESGYKFIEDKSVAGVIDVKNNKAKMRAIEDGDKYYFFFNTSQPDRVAIIDAFDGDKLSATRADNKVAFNALKVHLLDLRLELSGRKMAKGGWVVYADNQTTGKELLGTFPSKRFAEKYMKEVELAMLDNIGVAGYGDPKADSVGMMSNEMWDKKEAPYLMAKGGQVDWLGNKKVISVPFNGKTINFKVSVDETADEGEFYVFDSKTMKDDDLVEDLDLIGMPGEPSPVMMVIKNFLEGKMKGVKFEEVKGYYADGYGALRVEGSLKKVPEKFENEFFTFSNLTWYKDGMFGEPVEKLLPQGVGRGLAEGAYNYTLIGKMSPKKKFRELTKMPQKVFSKMTLYFFINSNGNLNDTREEAEVWVFIKDHEGKGQHFFEPFYLNEVPDEVIEPLIDGEDEIFEAIEELREKYGLWSDDFKSYAKGGLNRVGPNGLKRFNHKIGDLHDDLEDAKMSIDETQEFLQDIYGKDITYQDRLKYQYAKGGTTPESIQRMQEKLINDLWDRKGYDISYLAELPLNELKSLYDTEFYYEDEFFEKGGRLGFEGLAKKVAKRYEGKPVKAKYQKEYGKTYSKEEAMEVGRKVAAKVYGQQQANMKKMAKGGATSSSPMPLSSPRFLPNSKRLVREWKKQYDFSKLLVDSARPILNEKELHDLGMKIEQLEWAIRMEEENPSRMQNLKRLVREWKKPYDFSKLLVDSARPILDEKQLHDLGMKIEQLEWAIKYDEDHYAEGQKMAEGGSLMGHGLQVGDKIVEDLGSALKVETKDGAVVHVDLASGYRGKDMPLPFAKGGAVGGMTIPEIAKKFDRTTADVFSQLQVGEAHEMEHTGDPKVARKIALDHLAEDLDYYTKLKKIGL